ncbi:hypothetical protein BC936DRAFT_137712 [Jimgerdemannia flammicorona]|uniref:Uncharacterized protein n=1 Tax=Jimgerdemannia flammicorona TaxID=994334 RepID=A0A433CWT4_9FUNG|nr:hypothetical protein BC936DRAFT_137712 [Jimgerdemannia flammicorona]
MLQVIRDSHLPSSHRIIPPGTMVTMDYKPNRLNVKIDSNNVCHSQRSAEEARGAHNPEAGGSKPPAATNDTFFSLVKSTPSVEYSLLSFAAPNSNNNSRFSELETAILSENDNRQGRFRVDRDHAV